MAYVEYRSNNSGGSWWLEDKDWHALESAGWIVQWAGLSPLYTDDGNYIRDEETGVPKLVPHDECNSKFGSFLSKDGRYLGALAKTAYRVGLGLREAALEWEKVTGQDSTDAGCACCGQPHDFTEYDTSGKFIKSGPEAVYRVEWAD